MTEPEETAQELAEAYKRSTLRNSMVVKVKGFATIDTVEETRDSQRELWATKVSAFLATDMGNGIPTDNLIAMLDSDPIGPYMEAIEKAGAATLAICDACELDDRGDIGAKHDLVILRLETLPNEDPWEWIDNGTSESFCPFGWDDTAEDLMRTAMSICERIYWPTSTERLQGLSLRIIWPMGYNSGSADGVEQLFDASRANPAALVSPTD